MAAAVRIGTSGWQYAHWRGDFYPATLATSRWFEFYAERFATVELNTSFYRLPRPMPSTAGDGALPRELVARRRAG